MHPREHRGEISRCELRAEETVQDNGRGDEQDHELSGGSNVSPAKHCANHGPAQDVHCPRPDSPERVGHCGRLSSSAVEASARPGACLSR